MAHFYLFYSQVPQVFQTRKFGTASVRLGVLLYLCLHPLIQNNQIRHGNTYGEGRAFTWSVMPLRLHKCVVRFVSDSWAFCLQPSVTY